MAKLEVAEIKQAIKQIGLANNKAKNLKQMSQQLIDRHGGEVPKSFEALEALAGVGHKTASVVMSQAFGHPAFPVDTHIHRLMWRWGLSNGKSVEQTEKDAKRLFPKELWNKLHLQIIYYGRAYSPARDPDPFAPCSAFTPRFHQGDFRLYEDVMNFGKEMDVISIEIEQVNVGALRELQALGKRVFPDPDVLEMFQNKAKQKSFYLENDIPVAPLVGAQDYPLVQKLEEGGYDGKGVKLINNADEAEGLLEGPSFYEACASIQKELACIVWKLNDQVLVSPLVEQVFDPGLNLVDYLLSPAEVSEEVENRCKSIAHKLGSQLKGSGFFAIEFFWNTDDAIWVNETAPRLHNSGHVGMESWNVSQFDAFVRLLLEMPMYDWRSRNYGAMLNLIGKEWDEVSTLVDYQEGGDVYLHWYNKKESRPGRKMGHLNVLGSDYEVLKRAISELKKKV
ncbi:unnamed protein product [Cyprideis torosa]|uniref:Uncharacterized protein n=1 Tax=Cyprideis torosa TaxID=163714 RepID=A0A7R8WL75_9CRUS|nr:unnamed protein product [Cyprideis torosa]CAG0904032.1 unnamed protein product [Cyprideis torosa]